MSTPRDIRLTPRQLALKLATRLAVEAAGGQGFVAGELGRAQSRVSDWCSDNTADFVPLDLVAPLEALAAGAPGHPAITRALARQQGLPLGNLPVEPERGREDLGDWLAVVAAEHADLVGVLAAEDLSAGIAPLSARARERIVREGQQLMVELQRLLTALDGGSTSLGGAVSRLDPARRSQPDSS